MPLEMFYSFLQDWFLLSGCYLLWALQNVGSTKLGIRSDALEEIFYCFQFFESSVCFPISFVSPHSSLCPSFCFFPLSRAVLGAQ